MKRKNVGLWANRLSPKADNPREVAFADQWDHDNSVKTRFNAKEPHVLNALLYGVGVDLNDSTVVLDQEGLPHDRVVAATLIQWLGSNIGLGFLESALDRCGYTILKRDDLRLMR